MKTRSINAKERLFKQYNRAGRLPENSRNSFEDLRPKKQ